MLEDGTPIFVQVAEQLRHAILTGAYAEGAQVPSINELALFYRINPATANKAVAELVSDGVLAKRRGIGMFVADGARERIATRRRGDLVTKHIQPLVNEARALGIDTATLIELVTKEAHTP